MVCLVSTVGETAPFYQLHWKCKPLDWPVQIKNECPLCSLVEGNQVWLRGTSCMALHYLLLSRNQRIRPYLQQKQISWGSRLFHLCHTDPATGLPEKRFPLRSKTIRKRHQHIWFCKDVQPTVHRTFSCNHPRSNITLRCCFVSIPSQGVINVVRWRSCSRMGTLWYLFHTSNTIVFLPRGTERAFWNGDWVWWVSRAEWALGAWKSTVLRGSPFHFAQTTILQGEHPDQVQLWLPHASEWDRYRGVVGDVFCLQVDHQLHWWCLHEGQWLVFARVECARGKLV